MKLGGNWAPTMPTVKVSIETSRIANGKCEPHPPGTEVALAAGENGLPKYHWCSLGGGGFQATNAPGHQAGRGIKIAHTSGTALALAAVENGLPKQLQCGTKGSATGEHVQKGGQGRKERESIRFSGK